ncbi:helix-turn-helix domain-containing protein [Streptomyces sp. NBC_01214]|uniref:telomere-protecting terminal protein Tpg n=1 Tax=Streptomyces sp. NBC_01214 TaxID=2903777 RepID=UPI00224D4C4C|nr:helix-turn-helix domain-containing protein [Streptomyces sp. NBC_01214]MCX4808992.1 helix-turn-helix domain-containing protein [Streptomyces sp. NBC_01214]
MGAIRDALDRARNAVTTRPIPVRTGTRLAFLLKKEKGSTAAVAARLGVSQRSVQRYLKGDRAPSPAAAAALEREVRQDWQPKVKARAEKEAARRGIVVETRARFGFRAPGGTTDDARLRRITQHITPENSAEAFAAYRAGASEDELAAIVGGALGESYFRDGGRRAQGLDVELTDIDYIDIGY